MYFDYRVRSSNCVNSISNKSENNLKRWIRRRVSSNSSDPCVSCTTFNILAPIYKRLDPLNQSCRESEFREYWLSRNQSILDRLLVEKSSIICLQEFWVGNAELVEMYEKRLDEAGYANYKLARTNNRGDGLLTAVHKDYFRVLNYRDLLFNDFGDRVAQLLHVQSAVPYSQSQIGNLQQEILIVNTHLLFPHNSCLSIARLHQVYKILKYVESYQGEHMLNPLPVILCGDWNGSKRGHVYKFLRSQGFVSSYDTVHRYTDSDADAHKWVSHRNHRGNICGVDFIWLLNPNKHRKPLRTSWKEAVLGIIKNHLRTAFVMDQDAFHFLKTEDSFGDYITFTSFCLALQQLGLSGHDHGLSPLEVQDLWNQLETDQNGVLDYNEFQRIWDPQNWGQTEERETEKGDFQDGSERDGEAVGFDVKDAVLFPPEVEKGMWPENYSLSDHARLTVVFSPVKMLCSHAIC
ncbi:hypothetical protein AMTRI_Chr09g37410 [Amborella trichopoda]